MTEEEECFNLICRAAEENMQPIPFNYYVDGDNLWCECNGMNPSIYAQRINSEWVAFFEA